MVMRSGRLQPIKSLAIVEMRFCCCCRALRLFPDRWSCLLSSKFSFISCALKSSNVFLPKLLDVVPALSQKSFGARYCAPTRGFKGNLEYKGADNLQELNLLLLTTCMIRRKVRVWECDHFCEVLFDGNVQKEICSVEAASRHYALSRCPRIG